MLQVVELRLDEEQVRARLDGQESRSWDVDTDGAVEVLDGGTDGCESACRSVISSGRLTSLELNNSLAVVRDLVVDNDLHVEDILVHDPLDGLQVAP